MHRRRIIARRAEHHIRRRVLIPLGIINVLELGVVRRAKKRDQLPRGNHVVFAEAAEHGVHAVALLASVGALVAADHQLQPVRLQKRLQGGLTGLGSGLQKTSDERRYEIGSGVSAFDTGIDLLWKDLDIEKSFQEQEVICFVAANHQLQPVRLEERL